MDGYIKKSEAVDVIVKYPYDIAGKTATAIKMIEDLPSADVVPKSELEISQHLLKDAWKRIEELDELCGELQRKYDLAVAEREANVKGFAEELEKANDEIERLKYNLKAVLEEIPETKREFASEIFAEIDKNFILISIYDIGFEELKKKYTEGEQ